jgi:hypothetical protein
MEVKIFEKDPKKAEMWIMRSWENTVFYPLGSSFSSNPHIALYEIFGTERAC